MTLEEAICILNQNNWRGGHWQLHSSGYGIQNNSDTYSLDTLKLFHEDAIAIAKSIHLEAALAECEREKERISLQYGANLPATCDWGNCDEKATGFRCDDAGHGWLPICDKHNPLVADLSRKLAAARECRQAENSDDRPRGWQDWCITHSQSVWRCLAALTEAGEGEK